MHESVCETKKQSHRVASLTPLLCGRNMGNTSSWSWSITLKHNKESKKVQGKRTWMYTVSDVRRRNGDQVLVKIVQSIDMQ